MAVAGAEVEAVEAAAGAAAVEAAGGWAQKCWRPLAAGAGCDAVRRRGG